MATGIDILKRQHEQLIQAFEELELTTGEEARIRLLAHIGQRLKAHAAVEDEIFYPAVKARAGRRAEKALADALAAHQAIDVTLDEVMGSSIGEARTRALRDLAQRHFEDEEANLFPLARALDESDRGRLDREIDDYLDEYGDGEADTLPSPG